MMRVRTVRVLVLRRRLGQPCPSLPTFGKCACRCVCVWVGGWVGRHDNRAQYRHLATTPFVLVGLCPTCRCRLLSLSPPYLALPFPRQSPFEFGWSAVSGPVPKWHVRFMGWCCNLPAACVTDTCASKGLIGVTALGPCAACHVHVRAMLSLPTCLQESLACTG